MQRSQLKTVSIIFLLAGMFILLLLGGIPAIYSFIISTRSYMPFQGIFASPAVGFDNYRQLTSLVIFPQLMGNSFILGVVPSLLAVAVAIPAALVVEGMGAGRRRLVATFALLLPAFVPDIVLAFLVQSVFSFQTLANPALFRVIMVLLLAIRPAAICAFVGACAAGFFKDKGKTVLYGAAGGVFVGIAANLVRFLSSNIDLQMLLRNALVLSTTETFDTFSFSHGFVMFNLSLASAAWVFRTLPQMFAAVLVAFAVAYCVRVGLNAGQTDIYHNEHGSGAGLVPGIIGALVLVICLFMAVVFGGGHGTDMLLSAIGSSFIMTFASVILFGALLLMLAAWLCLNIDRPGALILMLVLAAIVNNIVGEFLFYRLIGIIHTYHAVVLANAINITFVLPLAYLARLNSRGLGSLAGLVRAMLPYFVVFVGLFAANTWGSSFNQMLFLASGDLMGVPALMERTMAFGSTPSVGVILGVTMPVLIFAVVTGFVFVIANRVTDDINTVGNEYAKGDVNATSDEYANNI